jgi:hypothetical protein
VPAVLQAPKLTLRRSPIDSRSLRQPLQTGPRVSALVISVISNGQQEKKITSTNLGVIPNPRHHPNAQFDRPPVRTAALGHTSTTNSEKHPGNQALNQSASADAADM